MPYVSLKARYGTWYRSDEPTTVKYNKTSYLAIRASGPTMHSYVFFSNPFNIPGAVVQEAKLYFYMQGGTTNQGTRSISVQRVAKALKFTTMHYNNRPTQFTGATRSKSTTGPLSSKHQWEVDVTADLQAVANGGTFYGYILTTTAPFVIQMYGAMTAYPPTLFVRYAYPPTPPKDLSPALGRVVGITKPFLGFSYYDIAGEESITGLQVQTSPTSSGFGSPAWDSGQVATTTTGLNLADTTFPARVANQTTWWRVRARSSAGEWSDYSSPTSFKYVAQPVVTVTSPADGATISDGTPPITWTYSGAPGTSPRAWQSSWWEERGGKWVVIARSPHFNGPPAPWTPDKSATVAGRRYLAQVSTLDNMDREATPGDNPRRFGDSAVTFQPSASVAPVTDFNVESAYPRPEVALSWKRSAVPDHWAIFMDDREIARIPGPDLRQGTSTSYSFDARAPKGTHKWHVRAVENGRQGSATALYIETDSRGTWLYDQEGRSVCIQDDREHSGGMAEVSAVHEPLGSDRVVIITQSLRGLEGSLSGLLVGLKGQAETPELWRKNLMTIKEQPGLVVDLVMEDFVIPVNLRKISITGAPRFPEGWAVSFEFYQQGGTLFDTTMGG